ncbi:TonB-dependent receptor [Ferruginibacter albus]|uniref:TonB-dependent receptor n=1 Tax=Ferruginibacter albus TaxID=2875540 RepID=UPI001CC70512|nr:TonB-dependent receptor [Ferruginibacter albus]UAY51027.1 TonB-dependent receptor [Ferruginibacter albus]
MKKILSLFSLLLSFTLISVYSFAQVNTVSGTVVNSATKEKVGAVSVTVKEGTTGTFTDDKGNFKLTVAKFPATLIFSSIGYELQEVTVNSASDKVAVDFKPASSLGQEIVVAASRVSEKILVSPVSIERLGTASIRNAAAPDYYDIVKTLKGVDVVNSSLTFSSLTTRGFNGSGNPRFNQFTDGMDNQAPGLNFSVGSIVGPSELDVDNAELLQGASSALYGSGGMNGTLLVTSKNPFKYQGVSAEVKAGIMHVNDPAAAASPYYNAAVRWGQKVNDKFAFKMDLSYMTAKDWVASDTTNYTGVGNQGFTIPGTRASDPNYNGVNVYGDETSANMQDVANSVQNQIQQGVLAATGGTFDLVSNMNTFLPVNATPQQIQQYIGNLPAQLQPYASQLVPFNLGLRAGIIPDQNVSRTGYAEKDIINSTTKVMRLNGGLFYKITPRTELSAVANYSTGNSVYTGSDRYALKNLEIGQYKLEIRNDKWFVRAYTTQENSGDAYNATVNTQLFNEAWKPSTTWFPEYVGNYVQSFALTGNAAASFANARAAADIGRPVPGTAQFSKVFDSVAAIPIPNGGKFLDRTSLYQLDGQYNFGDAIKFAEVTVGGSYRLYRLNSQGTLFADTTGPINTTEYGAYLQLSKKFFDDVLKLTVSGRYDKNENFDGKFTPRVSAVIKAAEGQYLRLSYQNAYRFPSNQNQWINLNVGDGRLIGGLPSLREFYHFDTNPPVNPLTGQIQQFGTYKPESVNSYEAGYKALVNKNLLVDVYGYFSKYQDFIGRINVAQSKTGNPQDIDPTNPNTYTGFSVSVNSPNKVNTYGCGISVDYLIGNNYNVSINWSNDNIDNADPTFVTYFSTPQNRANISLGNSGLGRKKVFGFNVLWRWQDAYYTQSDFKQGINTAFSTLDAQVSYKLMKTKSMIKIGATNLLNHYYTTAYGNPSIGGLYYVSLAYNVF